MALIKANRVRETTISTGIGNLVLLGAVSDHRSFGSVMSIGDTAWVGVNHPGVAEWQAGLMTYIAANTLAWTEIDDSSNSGFPVNFSSGIKEVILDISAERFGSTESLEDLSVTTPKIDDLAVTLGKLESAVQNSLARTGVARLTLNTTASPTWVMANDGTIGDATSAATARANADCAGLFAVLWTNVSNTYAAVSGGRGASAAADFAAHKTIALTKQLGRAIAIAGAGSGLTSRSLGETAGAETVTLDTTMIPSHTHVAAVTDPGHDHPGVPNSWGSVYYDSAAWAAGWTSGTGNSGSKTTSITVSNSNTGGGAAHANLGPRGHWNIEIKL